MDRWKPTFPLNVSVGSRSATTALNAPKSCEARSTRTRASDSSGTDVLELLAHVARVGDIRVSAGQWIAGPESPAQIEGLAVKWRDRPRDLDLKYAVRVGRGTSTLMRANGDGSFVGTRGQARPLTEVRFELGGQAAKAHEFVIDALFRRC